MQPPIEHLRYVHTLPLDDGELARAKRAHVGLWVMSYMVLGAAPVVIRAPAPLSAATMLGAIIAVTAIAGAVVTAQR